MSTWQRGELATCGCGKEAEIVVKARWPGEHHVMRHENGDWCENEVVKRRDGSFRFNVVETGRGA